MKIDNRCNFPLCRRHWIDGDGFCAVHQRRVYKKNRDSKFGEWGNRTFIGKLHLLCVDVPFGILVLIVCGLTNERPM